jgi:protein-S-isoprenylcysteine O-methyltransferase Ste14
MRALENKIPPPLVGLGFAALMWLVSRSELPLVFDIPGRPAIAAFFWSLGVACSLAGVFAFHRAKTTINPLSPEAATTMVTSGIYQISRNPMYLGIFFTLIGWAVWLSHLSVFALLPFFILYINRFQIEPEERALASKFGGQFTAYATAVRRWL